MQIYVEKNEARTLQVASGSVGIQIYNFAVNGVLVPVFACECS